MEIFEFFRRAASGQVKVYAECHNVEIFAILLRRRSEVYVTGPKYWGEMEISCFLVDPSLSILAF